MQKRTILSLRVASMMARKGYEIVEKKPNYHYPQFDVFKFENTPEFEEDLEKVLEQVRAENAAAKKRKNEELRNK